jgi:hypothetical protein
MVKQRLKISLVFFTFAILLSWNITNATTSENQIGFFATEVIHSAPHSSISQIESQSTEGLTSASLQLDPPDTLFGEAGTLYVDLRWWPPLVEELSYDVVPHDWVISWDGGGAGWAVRFTPIQYPALIVAGRYMRTSYLGSDPTTPINVAVWGATGGAPSNLLTDIIQVQAPGADIWFDVDYTSYVVTISSMDADFFTGWYSTQADQHMPANPAPTDERSWGYNGQGWYRLPDIPNGSGTDLDLAIRALVSYGYWQIQRYNIYRSLNEVGPFDSVGAVNFFPYNFTFRDTTVEELTTYWYYITAVYAGGESDPSNLVSVTTPEVGILSGGSTMIPGKPCLGQNYPNPFSNKTCLTYSVSSPGYVDMKVYDLTGKLVKTLISDSRSPGNYLTYWDGTDEQGRLLGSGVYFYRLIITSDKQKQDQAISFTKKLLILR